MAERPSSCCSGFGRYQAVETFFVITSVSSPTSVAVGLAAIRPLKLMGVDHITINVLVAVGLAAIRPLKLFQPEQLVEPPLVAVGLAAIRPLKLFFVALFFQIACGCSGFGRYQAVETGLRPFGIRLFFRVAVGLAAIRPLKPDCMR